MQLVFDCILPIFCDLIYAVEAYLFLFSMKMRFVLQYSIFHWILFLFFNIIY